MTNDLAQEKCIPCTGKVPPLAGAALDALQQRLGGDWDVVDGHHLEREFTFPSYAGALAFLNEVAAIAEAQNHHPDLLLTYGKVQVTIWTHKIDGLTMSDFVFAAKVDAAYDA